MQDILKKIFDDLRSMPIEQLKEEWTELSMFDDIGPNVSEYLKYI